MYHKNKIKSLKQLRIAFILVVQVINWEIPKLQIRFWLFPSGTCLISNKQRQLYEIILYILRHFLLFSEKLYF